MRRKNIFVKAVLTAAILVSVLISFQCIEKPLSPIAPYTDIQMSIPLFNHPPYDFTAIRSTVLKTQTDGDKVSFYLDTTGAPQVFQIGEISVQPPNAVHQKATVPAFEIAGLSPVSVNMTAKDLGMPDGLWYIPLPPVPPVFPGVPPFPGLDTTLGAPFTFDVLDTLEYAYVKTGSLTLTLTNTLPFRIAFPKGFILKNDVYSNGTPVDTSTIGAFTFPELDTVGGSNPNSASSTINLAGKKIWGKIKFLPVEISIKGRPDAFQFRGGIAMAFSCSRLVCSEVRALITSWDILAFSDSVMVVDDSVMIKEASLKSGQFDIVFINNLDVSEKVYIKLHNFVKPAPSTDTLIFDREILGNQTVRFTVSLKDWLLRTVDPNAVMGTKIEFSIGIRGLGRKATIREGDYVEAGLEPTNEPLRLAYLEGKIKPTYIPIEVGTALNIGEVQKLSIESIRFDSITVKVFYKLDGLFTTKYDLKLFAKNSKEQHEIIIPPPAGQTEKQFNLDTTWNAHIVLDNTVGLSTAFSKFALNPPESIFVKGYAIINPIGIFETPQGLRRISDNAQFGTKVSINLPVKIGIIGGEFSDTANISGAGFPTDIASSVRKASVYFLIENGLPFGFKFKGEIIGPDQFGVRKTLFSIPRGTDTTVIKPAVVNNDGRVIQAEVSRPEITLTDVELAQMEKAETIKFRIFDIGTSKYPNGLDQRIVLHTTDYIRVRASANLVYTVNKPK
jgi:hypothetical protein